MNDAPETPGDSFASVSTGKAGMKSLQMAEHRPENLFRQACVPLLVGMGEVVAAGRRGGPQRHQKPAVQAQGVADIVEADGVGQVCVDQADQMAPWRKRPRFFCPRRSPEPALVPDRMESNCKSAAARQIGCGLVWLFYSFPAEWQGKALTPSLFLSVAREVFYQPISMVIREETEEDFSAIGDLNRRVFGGEYEVHLIENLRSAHLILASVVALDGNEVVGHILFSALPAEIDGKDVNAAALAPMAVSPERQRRGIGSQLVTEGLARIRQKQVEAVIVLGHTKYYPRFGFSPILTQKLASPFQGMAEFMALELVAGTLSGQKGSVKYPKAFGLKD